MLPRTLRRCRCAFAALFLLHAGHAAAITLDWDSVGWADGSLNNSFDVDPDVPGDDINVNVTSDNGAALVPYAVSPNPQTPTVNAVFQGGLPTIENTLTIAVDLANPFQSVTVTVSFASLGGADNVSFQIFDLDAGGPYQDQLTAIHGLSVDGATLIAPTITTSADNTLIGVGLDQTVVGIATTPSTGLNSGRANVTISFGSDAIQSFSFTYGGTAAFADPGYQHFGVHEINFTPIPEVNPAFLSALACVAAAGLFLRHRSRVRKQRTGGLKPPRRFVLAVARYRCYLRAVSGAALVQVPEDK